MPLTLDLREADEDAVRDRIGEALAETDGDDAEQVEATDGGTEAPF